jgi:hypothetical protein
MLVFRVVTFSVGVPEVTAATRTSVVAAVEPITTPPLAMAVPNVPNV